MFPKFKFLPLVYLLVVLVSFNHDDSRFVSGYVEREREALLRFRQGLKDDIGYLSAWQRQDDCCEWYETFCNNTGHVIYLYLASMSLRGNITSDLLELTHLIYLDLSRNSFGGSIPGFLGSMKSLQDLRLAFNNFTGVIPHQLGNLTDLQVLTLNFNSLVGKVPKSFVNLTHLQFFYINVNSLGEPLADLFAKLSCGEMVYIDVSFNSFTGPIPDLGACLVLQNLSLHHNPLSGPVPASLGKISSLEFLDIAFNYLNGTVSESLFSKLVNLKWLDISFNNLTMDLSPHWIPPFSLKSLTLGTCKMGPSFPSWIRTQTNLSYLDVSDAGITDLAPNWLWNFSQHLTYFNISQNEISGTIPHLSFHFLGMIDVSSNNFSGPLPLLHPNVTLAFFSQNMFSGSISFICEVFSSQLILLDLSDNILAGEVPNCWNNTRELKLLNLNGNSFHGEIPHGIGSLSRLETLHLRDNGLSGQLPPSLRKCRNLLLIDIGGNYLDGNIPKWIGLEFPNLTHLSLRRNRFHGEIPSSICYLTHIQLLDLSGNNVSGRIPPCFDNFTSLVNKGGPASRSISFYIDYRKSYFDNVLVQWKGRYFDSMLVQWKGQYFEFRKTLRLLKLIDLSNNGLAGEIPAAFASLRELISLNLSRNSLTGRIDSNIGRMEMLENLDLSNNQLSGDIPTSFARLHYLDVLDLSNNNLTGQIPVGVQLQSFTASAYAGNNGLCGPPLPLCLNSSICDGGEKMKKESQFEFEFAFWFIKLYSPLGFFISVVLGFIVGFWGVVGSFVLNRSLRTAWFGFVDAVGDRMYDAATLLIAKFRWL